jgi:hypothetical protein
MFANAGLNFMSSIPQKLSRLCGVIGDDVSTAHTTHSPESSVVAYFEYYLQHRLS